MGLALPASVRRTYRIYDATSNTSFGFFGFWYLLPLEEVIESAKSMREMGRDIEFHDDYWKDSAIPIMAQGSGDLAYARAAPDREETSLVEWDHERVTHEQLAPSFCAFVRRFVDDPEDGKYEYDPEGPALYYEGEADRTPGY